MDEFKKFEFKTFSNIQGQKEAVDELEELREVNGEGLYWKDATSLRRAHDRVIQLKDEKELESFKISVQTRNDAALLPIQVAVGARKKASSAVEVVVKKRLKTSVSESTSSSQVLTGVVLESSSACKSPSSPSLSQGLQGLFSGYGEDED